MSRYLAQIAGASIVWAAGAGATVPEWPVELSGAARLDESHLLLVDDEVRHQAFVCDWRALERGVQPVALPVSMNDLEAAATDARGQVYLLTSHAPSRRGRLGASRRRLVRLGPGWSQDDAEAPVEVVTDLLAVLQGALEQSTPPAATHSDPVAVPVRIDRHQARTPGRVNLEGLAASPNGAQLYVGARSPIQNQRAVVVELEAETLFKEDTVSATVHWLPLGGRGIRGLDWLPESGGSLVVLAAAETRSEGAPILALWDLPDGHSAGGLTQLSAPQLAELPQPEAVVARGAPGEDGAFDVWLISERRSPAVVALRVNAVSDSLRGSETHPTQAGQAR